MTHSLRKQFGKRSSSSLMKTIIIIIIIIYIIIDIYIAQTSLWIYIQLRFTKLLK